MFRPHEIEWTPERIARFWDYYSSNPALSETYFAQRVGRSVVEYVGKMIDIGTAVDIGCGRGDLIDHLLRAGFPAYGMDQSQSSISTVLARFRDNPLFLGAGNEPPQAETAFMLEVVEHMNDEALDQALGAARRLLKPGGHLVVTTPNEEDLDASKVMCAECGCIFHRIQHVRSWSARTLRARLESAGFQAIRCEPYRLEWRHGLMGEIDKIRFRRQKPNLIYIGRLEPEKRLIDFRTSHL
jgi:2-polyprenyl-3-methyl-5-hydroxy-6-metoxy-1,4-benzoquinol methylase